MLYSRMVTAQQTTWSAKHAAFKPDKIRERDEKRSCNASLLYHYHIRTKILTLILHNRVSDEILLANEELKQSRK